MKKLLVLLGWTFALLLPAEDFTVNGLKVQLLGNKPGPQKTVIVLSKSRASVTSSPEELAPIIAPLLAKKWTIVVVDLPATGDDGTFVGSEFVHNITAAWKARMDLGENVIENFSRNLSAVVDRLLLEKIVNPKYIYVYGRGEGGILALDFAASDSRIKATVLQSPITDLRVFPHYASFAQTKADNATIRACSAKLKGEALSDVPIRIVMGPDDRLNDTDAAVEFMGSMRVGADVELKIVPALMSSNVGADSLVKYLLEKRK